MLEWYVVLQILCAHQIKNETVLKERSFDVLHSFSHLFAVSLPETASLFRHCTPCIPQKESIQNRFKTQETLEIKRENEERE